MIPLTWPPFVPGLGVLWATGCATADGLRNFLCRPLATRPPSAYSTGLWAHWFLAPLLGLLAGAAVWGLAYLAARSMAQRCGNTGVNAQSPARLAPGCSMAFLRLWCAAECSLPRVWYWPLLCCIMPCCHTCANGARPILNVAFPVQGWSRFVHMSTACT